MSICMAMGEALGMAAALCVREGCTPRTLDVKKLQAALESKEPSKKFPKNILAWTYHSHNFVTGEKSWDHMHT